MSGSLGTCVALETTICTVTIMHLKSEKAASLDTSLQELQVFGSDLGGMTVHCEYINLGQGWS